MKIKFIDVLLDESKRQESAIKSYLIVMITHMLKCKYQADYFDKTSWRNSIFNGLSGMISEFDTIGKGSLYKSFYLKKLNLNDIYQISLRKAMNETQLPKSSFPDSCEWNKEDFVDFNFIDNFINEYGYGSEENRQRK